MASFVIPNYSDALSPRSFHSRASQRFSLPKSFRRFPSQPVERRGKPRIQVVNSNYGTPGASPGSKCDPVGFLKKLGISHKMFATFLRERYKVWKDLKYAIIQRFTSLQQFASGYEVMGMRRNHHHGLDFLEWAPGSSYCSLVGDFNGWSPLANCAREHPYGNDDYGRWFVIVEDKMTEDEDPDEFCSRRYDSVDDYDKADSGAHHQIVQKPSEEYFGITKQADGYAEMCDMPVKSSEQICPSAVERKDELYNLFEEEKKKIENVTLPDHNKILRTPLEPGIPPPLCCAETSKGCKAWMKKYLPAIPHGCRYRVYFRTPNGPLERVPAWATYVISDVEGNQPCAVHWEPPPNCAHKWQHSCPEVPKSLRIYECHVGISGSKPRISSFKDFAMKVLLHAKEAGYNAIQLFGVIEHMDYSTCGYRVTNFFAVSSRYGTPEDFKKLVDQAHGMGLLVFLDIVHSYASGDEMVGLSLFDGSNDCYFHKGRRGHDSSGHTRKFKYGDLDVVHFLLSNLCWWVEEYKIDGFHFHSLPSMIYTYDAVPSSTSGLDEYCSRYVDKDALVYLIMANEILHTVYPNIITIAEDETHYPGLCEPIFQGGLGFDYCTNLSASNMWRWLLEEVPDQNWSMSTVASTLVGNKQHSAKMLIYAENHNQSTSTRGSFAEILFGQWREHSPDSESLLRGCSLHKMIKLITFTIGARAYLNFMGNEFGHPKVIEFPMLSNNGSFSRANRCWDLIEKEMIHSNLFSFDKALMKLDEDEGILQRGLSNIHHVNDSAMVISYAKGPLLFVFNFHPTNCYEDYAIGVEEAGHYKVILNTDDVQYGGKGHIENDDNPHQTLRQCVDGLPNCLRLYLPWRSAQVYRLVRVMRF